MQHSIGEVHANYGDAMISQAYLQSERGGPKHTWWPLHALDKLGPTLSMLTVFMAIVQIVLGALGLELATTGQIGLIVLSLFLVFVVLATHRACQELRTEVRSQENERDILIRENKKQEDQHWDTVQRMASSFRRGNRAHRDYVCGSGQDGQTLLTDNCWEVRKILNHLSGSEHGHDFDTTVLVFPDADHTTPIARDPDSKSNLDNSGWPKSDDSLLKIVDIPALTSVLHENSSDGIWMGNCNHKDDFQCPIFGSLQNSRHAIAVVPIRKQIQRNRGGTLYEIAGYLVVSVPVQYCGVEGFSCDKDREIIKTIRLLLKGFAAPMFSVIKRGKLADPENMAAVAQSSYHVDGANFSRVQRLHETFMRRFYGA